MIEDDTDLPNRNILSEDIMEEEEGIASMRKDIFVKAILSKDIIYDSKWYKVLLSDGEECYIPATNAPDAVIQMYKKK